MPIILHVQTKRGASSERRFDTGLTIDALKARIELVTGIPASSQSLRFVNGSQAVAAFGQGQSDVVLSSLPLTDHMTLEVDGPETCVADVPKYVMSDSDYAARTNSVLAFKKKLKLGRFGPKPNMQPGQRCAVGDKHGTLLDVVCSDTGFWCCVQLDEPRADHVAFLRHAELLGTHYSVKPKHGLFVKPGSLLIGDFITQDSSLDLG